MKEIKKIKSILKQSADIPKEKQSYFFKTGPGDYAEHDRFMGVKNPILRQIAKTHDDLSFENIQIFIQSPINEERLLALFILTRQYQKAAKTNIKDQENIYQFYLNNLQYINNWNLVDASAHLIIGAHLFNHNKTKNILLTWAKSNILWERRISIVSTWYFIRNNEFAWTIKIAKLLLNDTHDLIHKSVGWMLREMGKRDERVLVEFLNMHDHKMPRTMLRYAIEKFPEAKRKAYLTGTSNQK